MRLISSETNLSGRLAVQGGKGNNYYDDPCDSTDRFDFVLANAPFNVNAADRDR